MEIKVYHTGNSFEDLIAKYLIVLDNNNIIFKGRLELMNPFSKKTEEVYVKDYLYYNTYFVGDTIK